MGDGRGWRWAVPVAAAAAGLLFVATARAAGGTDLRAERYSELADLVAERQRQQAEQVADVAQLRGEVAALVAAAADPETAQLAEQVAGLRSATGLEPVTGPGMTVTLTDAPVPADGVPADRSANDYVVHQQDVQAVVNALWAGGAEAIAVMDQRLVTTGAVRCVGNTLILHGRVYAPPYTVTAVGPVDSMQRALDDDPTLRLYREWVELVGLGYQVDRQRQVEVPGLVEPPVVTRAEPIP